MSSNGVFYAFVEVLKIRLLSWLVINFYWRPKRQRHILITNHKCNSLISDNVPLKMAKIPSMSNVHFDCTSISGYPCLSISVAICFSTTFSGGDLVFARSFLSMRFHWKHRNDDSTGVEVATNGPTFGWLLRCHTDNGLRESLRFVSFCPFKTI